MSSQIRRISNLKKLRTKTIEIEDKIELVYDEVKKIILKNTEITRDHLTPELALHLLTPNCFLYNAPIDKLLSDNCHENNLEIKIFNDPFWSIYWPGGQALTRFIFDESNNPKFIKNKLVFEMGSGCGATSIAAKLSGASKVVANDIDKIACIAARINAETNNVNIHYSNENVLLNGLQERYDVILVGDLLYDEEIAEILVPCLNDAQKMGSKIFVGDPGRHGLTDTLKKRMTLIKTYTLPENVRKENFGFEKSNVWLFGK